MTPEYKVRRESKHAAQAAAKPPVSGGSVTQTIDFTPRAAAHAFVGAKMHPQANGGRKNRSGYAEEHATANLDNTVFDMSKVLEDRELKSEDVGKER